MFSGLYLIFWVYSWVHSCGWKHQDQRRVERLCTFKWRTFPKVLTAVRQLSGNRWGSGCGAVGVGSWVISGLSWDLRGWLPGSALVLWMEKEIWQEEPVSSPIWGGCWLFDDFLLDLEALSIWMTCTMGKIVVFELLVDTVLTLVRYHLDFWKELCPRLLFYWFSSPQK